MNILVKTPETQSPFVYNSAPNCVVASFENDNDIIQESEALIAARYMVALALFSDEYSKEEQIDIMGNYIGIVIQENIAETSGKESNVRTISKLIAKEVNIVSNTAAYAFFDQVNVKNFDPSIVVVKPTLNGISQDVWMLLHYDESGVRIEDNKTRQHPEVTSLGLLRAIASITDKKTQPSIIRARQRDLSPALK